MSRKLVLKQAQNTFNVFRLLVKIKKEEISYIIIKIHCFVYPPLRGSYFK